MKNMTDDEYRTAIEASSVAFDSYATALGRVVHSWNRLHERLEYLFATIVGGHEMIPRRIWHSSNNDRAQRGMLKAAIEAVPSQRWEQTSPNTLKDLRWLIEEINSLATHRDNAVHAPVTTRHQAGDVDMITREDSLYQRARNLAGKELIVEFDYCERRSDVYWEFVGCANHALGGRRAWPNRPSLPNRRPKTVLLSLRRPTPAR
jgi:hypothetical protein